MTVLIAYTPVIHQGYLRWAESHPEGTLYVLSESIPEVERVFRKDPRAVPSSRVVNMIGGSLRTKAVLQADVTVLERLAALRERCVMPDEDLSRTIASKYLPLNDVVFERVFLRYDSRRTLAKEAIEAVFCSDNDPALRAIMRAALQESQKSPDWWRQVGAALVRDGTILVIGYNRPVFPSWRVYELGDPRSAFSKGVHVDLNNSVHAEQVVLGRASREGISTLGCDLFVTTFPCPYCANYITQTGIKRLLFADGYAMLEGVEKFAEHNIEVVRVPI